MSNLDLTIAEIMHGDTEVLKIIKGDVQKWPYVAYSNYLVNGDNFITSDFKTYKVKET